MHPDATRCRQAGGGDSRGAHGTRDGYRPIDLDAACTVPLTDVLAMVDGAGVSYPEVARRSTGHRATCSCVASRSGSAPRCRRHGARPAPGRAGPGTGSVIRPGPRSPRTCWWRTRWWARTCGRGRPWAAPWRSTSSTEADGSSTIVPIRERFEVGTLPLPWGQYPFLCVPDGEDDPGAASRRRHGSASGSAARR